MTATKPTAVEYTVNGAIFTIKPSGGRWVLLSETGDVLLKSRSYDKCVQHANETAGTPVASQEETPAVQPEVEETVVESVEQEIEKRETEEKETVAEPKPSKPKKEKVSAPNSETVTPNSATHANGAVFTEKRPGVLAVMVKCLKDASEKNPVTKEEVLDVLCATFPDRDRNKMKATLAMQMPAGLRYEKKIVLGTRDVKREVSVEQGGMLTTGPKKVKGYWIDEEATKTAQGK